MKSLFLVLVTLLPLQAQTLDKLVQSAYRNDPTIKLLQEEQKVVHEDVSAAALWENPVFKAGMTDIQLEDIGDRSLEPMQTQFVAVSQKIPLGDKLEIAREIAQAKEKLIHLKTANRKRTVLSRLSEYVYRIKIIQKRLRLLARNRNNLYRIKHLLKGYQAGEDLLLDVRQSLLLLQTKEEMLLGREEALKAEIERFTLQKVSSVEAVSLTLMDTDIRLNSAHPLLLLYREDIRIAEKKIALFRARERADVTVTGGYYQRAGRNDYLSLAVSMPLQIRGKEKISTRKAKALLMYQKARLQELQNSFASRVKVLGIGMRKNVRTYQLYQKEILPLQKRISRYLKAKNASGALDLTKLIESYNRVITLEDAALKELTDYFKNYATLRYYL